jgi:hypothetical protein
VTATTPTIELLRFSASMQSEMLALIIAIQRDEFGFDISAADQPDLLDVDGFYRSGAGDFWVATSAGRIVGTIALRDKRRRSATARVRCARCSSPSRIAGASIASPGGCSRC